MSAPDESALCNCNDARCAEPHEYFFRRLHADGHLIERFEGASAAAIHRGRVLAAELQIEVNMWSPRYGHGGSIRFFPWDLTRFGGVR